MAIRNNTLVFTFDPASPRTTAHDIQEWLYAEIRIKRQVYVKLTDKEYMMSITNGRMGHGEYKHHTGEIFPVETAVAGLGYKKIRDANLPPEILDDTLSVIFAPFGQVLNFQNEMWARMYRYTVANGVRQINMTLTQHVPSHLLIAG
jgi:hypothetical protein